MRTILILLAIGYVQTCLGQSTNTLFSLSRTNVITVDTQGRVIFERYPWTETSSVDVRPGANPPLVAEFNGGPARTYQFQNASDDAIDFTSLFSHDFWEMQPAVYAVLHWAECATTTAGTNVVFEIAYCWANMGQTFPSYTTIHVTNTVSGTNWTHRTAEFPAIANNGHSMGSMLVGKLRRLANSADADTYNKSVALLGFCIRYQVDTVGGSLGRGAK